MKKATFLGYMNICFICEHSFIFLRCRAHRIGKVVCVVKVTPVEDNFDSQLSIQIISIVRSALINCFHK